MLKVPVMNKLNVLVPHWREHNDEHIAELEKYHAALQAEGQQVMADSCLAVIAQMQQVSDALQQMAQQLKPIKLPQRGESDV